MSVDLDGLMVVPPNLRLVEGSCTPAGAASANEYALIEKVPWSRLEWPAASSRLDWRAGTLGYDCLWQFVRLELASATRILEFAQEFGVLGICEHGLPGSHNACPPRYHPYFNEHDRREEWHWEAVDSWRKLAAQVRALLVISCELRAGVTDSRSGWSLHRGMFGGEFVVEGKCRQEEIAEYTSYLLELAQLQLRVVWDSEIPALPQVKLGGGEWRRPEHNLFRVLVMQLVEALCQPYGVALCDICRHPFAPRRRPQSDWDRYCAACLYRLLDDRQQL